MSRDSIQNSVAVRSKGKYGELSLWYVLLISVVVHLFFLSFISLPYYFDPGRLERMRSKMADSSMEQHIVRDIIVNINPDQKQIMTDRTLLSDVDSAAKGYLTQKKGDNWLNNSLKFQQEQSQAAGGRASSDPQKRMEGLLLAENKVEYSITLYDEREFIDPPDDAEKNDAEEDKKVEKEDTESDEKNDTPARDQKYQWGAIPDKKGINLENAIYYSNTRQFSFNTKKFRDFEYFRQMKQKIANNWFPPIMANTPLTRGYTPGSTNIRVIASQEVKTYFILNRNGDVLSVKLVDSRGNRHLDESCLDAIRNSRNFGPVPDDISGEEVVIPFIFGYYIR